MLPGGTSSLLDHGAGASVGWRRRRAVLVLALVVIGYMLAACIVPQTVPSRWLLIGGGVFGVAGFFLRGWACRAVLALAVVALSAGWFRARCDESPAHDLTRWLAVDAALLRVEGRVVTTPELRAGVQGEFARFEPHASGAWHFDLAAKAVVGDAGELAPVSGTLRVHARHEPEGLRAGDRVVLRGFTRAARSAMNPGEPDRLRLARQSRVAGSIDVPSAEFITTPSTPETSVGSASCGWYRFTDAAQSLALGSLAPPSDPEVFRASDESTALLRAMLLGQRDDELRDLQGAFNRVGLAHVLSVSGMNLTLLAAFALYALRLLGDHPRLEKLGVALLVAGYLVVVPAEAPIIRAAIMIGVFIVAEWGGRRYDRLNTLAWAAVLSLLWRPMDLWSAGFQLSYLGVAGLIALAHPLRVRLFGEKPEDDVIGGGLRGLLLRMLEGVKTAFAASLCAWLITSPVVLWHTGVFSPIGPLANLVVWPVVGAITGAGYGVVLVGTTVPSLASWGTPALHALGSLLAWLVRVLDGVPGGVWYFSAVSAVWCTAATMLAWWWMVTPRAVATPRPTATTAPRTPLVSTRLAQSLAAAVLVIWLGIELWQRPRLPTGTVEIATLSIPGGGCTVMHCGRDTLLYGAGSSWGSAGQRTIPAALRAMGVANARTVVVPAADTSLYNAIPDIVRPMGVREVIVTQQFVRQAEDVPEGPAAHLLQRLEARGVKVRSVAAGDTIMIGGAAARVLGPPVGTLMETHRDASIVLEFVPPSGGDGKLVPSPAIVLGEMARPGFDALRLQSPSARVGVVVMPRSGWVATHAEQVARWGGAASEPPILISRGDGRAQEVPAANEIDTNAVGCARLRWTPASGWTTQSVGN